MRFKHDLLATTYSLTEDLSCAFIVDNRSYFVRSRIRLDWRGINVRPLLCARALTDPELSLHALFVLLTVLLFYLLVVLDRIHKLRLHQGSLVENERYIPPRSHNNG